MSAGITPVSGHYTSFPGSFIGRQIAFFHVRFVDTNAGSYGSPEFDYENFSTAVRIIQSQAEIIWMGVPWISNGYGAFMVAVSYDTANNAGEGNTASTIEELLQVWDNDAEFVRKFAVGSDWYDTSSFVSYVTNNNQFTTANNVFGSGTAEQDELNNLI